MLCPSARKSSFHFWARCFKSRAPFHSGTFAMAEKRVNKVVLAYSGGLDTSIILKWLQTT